MIRLIYLCMVSFTLVDPGTKLVNFAVPWAEFIGSLRGAFVGLGLGCLLGRYLALGMVGLWFTSVVFVVTAFGGSGSGGVSSSTACSGVFRGYLRLEAC